MAYRKMYKYSWIFIGAMLFETLLEIAVGFPEAVSNVINIAICVTFGWQGNHLYKDYVTKRIKEITPSSVLTEEARLQIVRGGGTNIGAALGFSAALFVLLIVITAASMR